MLEVGCGPGLVAVAVCRSGPASRVLLTDGDPQTLVNCLSNLAMNGHRQGVLLGGWREANGFVGGQQQPSASLEAATCGAAGVGDDTCPQVCVRYLYVWVCTWVLVFGGDGGMRGGLMCA